MTPKKKPTADAIDARFAQCLEQLPKLEAEDRAQLLRQLTPDKVAALRRARPTLFHQFVERTNTVKATGMTGNVSLVVTSAQRLKLASMCRLPVPKR